MKKLLLILLCFPMIGFGQKTYVPDDNFEQELINLGYDNILDDSVVTSNIIGVSQLFVYNLNIVDLTGIEDFTALIDLRCGDNQLTSLDVSQNTALASLDCSGGNQLTSLDVSGANALTFLDCSGNQLTSLDVSQNTALLDLFFHYNQLTSLDVSQNTALCFLDCSGNQLTSLDVSQNTALCFLDCSGNQLTSLDVSGATMLTELFCGDNQLTSLDVRNGNNTSIVNFDATNNPSLTCINVDDVALANIYWTAPNGNIDPQHYFSNNCNPSAIQELTTNKELLRVTDLLGRETKNTKQPLFYIYDDGTVEKKIIIE